ncbi:MAG: MerR family transcriptional regulator [Lachnospiraceae bacterium]|nr:MerR family transcriptional regulator [Lachnospiraceae bacterium]
MDKESKYSTNDLCQMFGVGRETLRHYENLGLLNPKINPENGYREYGYWDIGAMVDILKYRSVEMPLKEVKKAIFEMNYDEIRSALRNQQEIYRENIRHYQMLERKTNLDLMYMSFADQGIGVIAEFPMTPCYFQPYGNPQDPEQRKILQKIFSNNEFFATSWIFPEEEDPDAGPRDYIGFETELEFAEYLGMTGGFVVEPTQAAGAILDITGRDYITRETFADFEQELDAKYPNASGELIACLLSRFYDSDGVYHQYMFTFKKLK